MTVISATARHITVERFGPGVLHVFDGNTGNLIGQCDLVRGFARYYGVKGGAHEGVSATVRGGIEGLTAALAEGLRNGRDDREPAELAEPAPVVAVGDRFSDPNLVGSPCVVTAVDPAGEWYEARWMPGAPAHRYATSYAARLVKVEAPARTVFTGWEQSPDSASIWKQGPMEVRAVAAGLYQASLNASPNVGRSRSDATNYRAFAEAARSAQELLGDLLAEDLITIRHTHEHGTMIEGSTRGDGVYEIAREHGFRSGSVGLFVRGSRDRVAKRARINACAAALRDAGHLVVVEIDDTPRPREVVLADQAERLDDRRDALTAKTDRKQATADGHRAASDRLTEGYAMGQPLLVDHYSYPRELRRVTRAAELHHRAIDGDREAEQVRARAEAVGGDAAYAATPQATALRIPRLEAELREIGRRLDAYDAGRAGDHPLSTVVMSDHEQTLRARDTQLREQLDHDRMLIARATEAGTWTPWSKETVQVGDLVNVYSTGGQWRLVMRVSGKSVSVDSGKSWNDTVPYAKIRRHTRPDAEKAAAAVKAAKARQKEQKAAVAGWPA